MSIQALQAHIDAVCVGTIAAEMRDARDELRRFMTAAVVLLVVVFCAVMGLYCVRCKAQANIRPVQRASPVQEAHSNMLAEQQAQHDMLPPQ